MRWQDGYPCDSGSTNGQDSARLAGLMKVFKHPESDNFHLSWYVDKFNYFRHPKEINATPFSRDQASCLFAGLCVSNLEYFVLQDYQPENDIITPSVRGHFIRCAGFKANWFQDLWLWLDVIYSCFIDPIAEPNQLLCMLMVHPNKAYLKFWCKWNKQWAKSVRDYWCENAGAWRGEPELAEIMIRKIQEVVSDKAT